MSWVQDQTAWLQQLETTSGTLSQLELCFDTMADEHQLRAKASLSLESLSQGQQQAAQLLLNQTALEMKLHEQQALNADLSKRLRNTETMLRGSHESEAQLCTELLQSRSEVAQLEAGGNRMKWEDRYYQCVLPADQGNVGYRKQPDGAEIGIAGPVKGQSVFATDIAQGAESVYIKCSSGVGWLPMVTAEGQACFKNLGTQDQVLPLYGRIRVFRPVGSRTDLQQKDTNRAIEKTASRRKSTSKSMPRSSSLDQLAPASAKVTPEKANSTQKKAPAPVKLISGEVAERRRLEKIALETMTKVDLSGEARVESKEESWRSRLANAGWFSAPSTNIQPQKATPSGAPEGLSCCFVMTDPGILHGSCNR